MTNSRATILCAALVCLSIAACGGERSVPMGPGVIPPDAGGLPDGGAAPPDAGAADAGSDGGSNPATEVHTIHFTLSKAAWLPDDEDYVLYAAGKRHPLVKHTAASMVKYKGVFDALDDAHDPTHYVENVTLPADKVTRLHVRQHSDKNGRIAANHGAGVPHALSLMFIHIPDKARDKVLKDRRMRLKAAGKLKDEPGDLTTAALDTYGPDDIAHALIFHHPEMLNMDPDHGANIMYNYIQTAEGIDALAAAIQAAGPYGWYEQTPMLEDDGTPILDSTGTPMYSYHVTDEVSAATSTAMVSALNGTKNDGTLKGQSYNPTEGVTHTTEQVQSPPDGAPAPAPALKDAAGYTFALGSSGFHSGLRSTLSTSGSEVTLTMRNDYVRHLLTFIEFYDENDGAVIPESWDSFLDIWVDLLNARSFENDQRKFLALISAVPTIMGIPVAGDYNNTTLKFNWPMNARYAKLRAGGLGNGGDSDSGVTTIGVALTSVFELAIPTVLLASSAGMGPSSALLKSLADDISLAAAVVNFGYGVIYGSSKNTAGDIAAKASRFAADFVWKNKTVRNWIIEKMVASEMEEAVPFVGFALWALDMSSTAATIAQTSVEVATSPWIIENTIQPSHDINVIIEHDKDDYQFPATATRFKVLAKFSKNDTRVIEATLPVDPVTHDPVTVSKPRNVTFQAAPAGGHFDLEVLFYSDTGWLAGQVSLDDIANENDPSKSDQTITLRIEENLVPLDATSIYRHKVVLGYKTVEATYYWHGTHIPPTATYRDLSNDTAGDAMSGLGNNTISQTTGMLGYVWRAHYAGQQACPGNAGGGHLYMLRNINLAEDPNEGMMISTCGYVNLPFILYDFLPKDKATARNFVVVEKDGKYWVKAMQFADDGAFQMTDASLGYFPIEVHAMVAHPSGVLVAINSNYAKMYVLFPPATAVADAAAPAALPIAGPALHLGGAAVNPALLRHPVALKLTPENGVVVLDDVQEMTAGTTTAGVKGRLKVFTPDGTPVPYFSGSYQLDLAEPSPNVQVKYLDLGFESQGYIYILSYTIPANTPGYQITAADYHLDIYKPDGTHLVRTSGFAAARMTVDKWRNVFTLNYEHLVGKNGVVEPTVSEWIPPTPQVDGGADGGTDAN